MKEIAIGDLHGLDVWKKIVKDNKDASKFIFVADYFDSFYIPADKQKKNFIEIIEFKKKNKDLVELFIGNHDFHYLNTSHQRYAGHQKYQHIAIGELLNNAISEGLIKMCYLSNNTIFSHAGITKTWCSDNYVDMSNVEQSINDLFKYQPYRFEFIRGLNESGDNPEQSPLWVRPNSLIKDKIDGYRQVVGHTAKNKLKINNDVAFIDTLGKSGEYLIINNGTMSASEDLTNSILEERCHRFTRYTSKKNIDYIVNRFATLLCLKEKEADVLSIISALTKEVPEDIKRVVNEMMDIATDVAERNIGVHYNAQDVHKILLELFLFV